MQELFWAFGPFSVKCANVQISSVNSVWRTAACSPVHQLRSTWDQFLGTGFVWNLLLSSRWAVHSAQSAACCWKRVQVCFTQSVLRMRTMIKDGANPHHQHALQPHDRVCVCVYVCMRLRFFFLSFLLPLSSDALPSLYSTESNFWSPVEVVFSHKCICIHIYCTYWQPSLSICAGYI